ncbi:hypothetical protein GCM10025868_34740 [Angustibacter aerolatus]|uniref:Uncharacterized protein n=1 Tax=Angustibacter aerolatus TaxID=1162965 RepID=A0ABQ6JLK9_9ACTN|nr:hypothetical protein GCM10025868_34740 [Angustibacter aerolatus]
MHPGDQAAAVERGDVASHGHVGDVEQVDQVGHPHAAVGAHLLEDALLALPGEHGHLPHVGTSSGSTATLASIGRKGNGNEHKPTARRPIGPSVRDSHRVPIVTCICWHNPLTGGSGA